MSKNFNQGWLSVSIRILLVTMVAALAWSSSAPVFGQSYSKRFNKGDALRLTIWQPYQVGDQKNKTLDMNGDYLIDSRGYVFFPLIGDVNVLSHSVRTLSEALKEKFIAYIQDPVVIVEPLIRVAMLGAFRRPGTYLVPPDASLWQLVDLAGGPGDNSNLKKMYVERGGKIVKENLLGGFERAFTLYELGVRSGDQLLLPRRSQFGVKQAFEILRFALSLLNLYLVITRI